MELRSGIVLSGGKSKRMGVRKEFLKIHDKNFLSIIVETLLRVVDEVVVAIGFEDDPSLYIENLPSSVRIFRDELPLQSPLVGIVTGLSHVRATYAAVLSCDVPLVKVEVIECLFERAEGFDAAIPKWDDGRIEPLMAVYRAAVALKEAKEAISKGGLKNTDMIDRLRRVNYVNVNEFRVVDPHLLSFFNVNTPQDLAKVLALLESTGSAHH